MEAMMGLTDPVDFIEDDKLSYGEMLYSLFDSPMVGWFGELFQ